MNQKQTHRPLTGGNSTLELAVNNLMTTKLSTYPTKASITTITKTKPTLANGWANHSTTNLIEFYKQLDNTLVIQGIITNTTTPTHIGTIFTLPTGSMPKTKQAFVVRTNNGLADITVDTTGTVNLTAYITGTSPTQVHLNIQVNLT